MNIPYYVTRQRPGARKWAYWAPCLARRDKKTGKIEPTLMAKFGFKLVDCGEDGPRAWAIAKSWNDKWKAKLAAHRSGTAIDDVELARIYPAGSLGEAFARFRGLETWKSKKPRTREDWLRGFKQIEPVFGDVDPRTVSLEDLDGWYAALLDRIGVRESYRAMKIWRALWKNVGSLKRTDGERYCDKNADPSLGIRRQTPKKRNVFWLYDEAMPLIEAAWNGVEVAGEVVVLKGLAAALAVAWDSMLSPVDVRSLSLSRLVQSPQGPFFDVDRAKTGRAAIATLGPRTVELLEAYIASLPFTLHPDKPIFHTRGALPGARGGRPQAPAQYSKDMLSKDFRIVREALYPGDTRTIQDFRRSGAIEATAGEIAPAALAGKMANSIDSNKELQETYTPHTAALVRLADAARTRGREMLRTSKNGK